MKKIYSYISLVALAAISAGCAEELVNPEEQLTNSNKQEQVINGELTVQISVPASAQTKTVLGTKDGSMYPVYWSPEDVITLNGTAATEFTPSDDNTSATAKFKLTSLTAPYNFLYGGVSGKGDQVSYPATQNYVADGFDPAAMPMYASVTDLKGNVAFSHVGSLLRFSFTGENKISSITLTPADKDQSLSGNFTIGTSNGVLDGTLTPVSGSSSLLYSFGEDKQLSETPFIFYVAVPAGTYPGGIVLDVIDNEAGHMTVKVMENNETIAAGKVREFENVVYEPQKEANLIQISSDATLQLFASRVAAGEYYLNARVSADFTATSAWTPVDGYKGVFDGNGKTINGLDQPLFGELGGAVKNLTLNSTINATDVNEVSWGMFARSVVLSAEVDEVAGLYNCTAKGSLTYTPSSALSDNSYVGGLAGVNEGGVIDNCSNEADVTMGDCGEEHNGQVSVGGIIGLSAEGGDFNTCGEITNCTNKGSVTCGAKSTMHVFIGGVLGYQVKEKEKISGCENTGNVTVTDSFSTTADLNLGGVIGMGKGLIESCTNTGTVISEAKSTAASFICQGGVVGRLNRGADGHTYSGLTNAGHIKAAAAGSSKGAYLGGMVGRCDDGASISDCTNTGGSLEYTGEILNSPLHIGGIVGQSKGRVTSCTNATSIYFNADYKYNKSSNYLSIGGVVGKQDADVEISNNINTAAVTFEGYVTGYMALGGIVGYCSGPIAGGENLGTVSYKGTSTNQNVPIGGIAGRTSGSKTGDRITGVTNRGEIIINTTKQAKKDFYVGGVVGHHQSANLSAVNAGKVNIISLTCDHLNLGGLVGSAEKGSISGTNNGELTISESCAANGNLLAGGVVANSSETNLSNCINTGTITNAGSVTNEERYLNLGGIVAYNDATSPLTDCTNSGAVINTGNSANYVCIGGVSGETEAVISSCANTGNISNSGTSDNGNPTCVGGVAGLAYAIDVTSCSSATGKITNTSASLGVRVGGIVGMYDTAEAVNVSNCTNESEIYISNEVSVDTDDQILVGGIVGRGSPITFTSCANKGEIMVEMYGEDNLGGVIAGGIYGDNKSGDNAYLNDVTSCFNSKNIHTYYKYAGSSKTKLYATGGIAGIVLSSTAESETQGEINECSNSGYLYNESNRGLVGGIVADFQEGSIIDCTNTNTIEYAYNKPLATIIAVGGIVANAWEKAELISGCTNSGDVMAFTNTNDATRSNYAGGIVGLEENICEVRDCENTGSITCNTCAHSSNVAAMAGGIIGYKESSGTDYGNINRGDVTALAVYKDSKYRASAAGGVVGALRYGTIEACYNYGVVEAGEKASQYATENASSTSIAGRAGSITGYYQTSDASPFKACEGTITKCGVGGKLKSKYTSGKWREITAANFGGNIVGEGDDPTDCFFAGN